MSMLKPSEPDEYVRDGVIIAMWKSRAYDTAKIASLLKCHESEVSNRLAWLKDAGVVSS